MTESEILHNWLRAALIEAWSQPDDYCNNYERNNYEPYKCYCSCESAGNGSARQDKSLIVSMRRTKTWYTK